MVAWKDIEELTAKIHEQSNRIMKLVYIGYAEIVFLFLIFIFRG